MRIPSEFMVRDSGFAKCRIKNAEYRINASFGRSKGFLHFGYALSRNDSIYDN